MIIHLPARNTLEGVLYILTHAVGCKGLHTGRKDAYEKKEALGFIFEVFHECMIWPI